MNFNVILAIFKRNFSSYFANPTGYVFICGFVLASGFAAFWPHEFFNSNLANLDQLNKFLPFIMLFFVPAITMSIWAEERRQGTDELLLTIPASDLDVVVGKYLAAVAIFTVSLLFSLSNLIVLGLLGNPDPGLMAATYVGYWMVGVTMLAIGMVASFLTKNITVGFVLGIAFNVPLVFAATSDMIIAGSDLAVAIGEWSVTAKFQDFARGVISVSSVVYFVSIVAAMLYLCMVLIGRRHWASGSLGGFQTGHYIVRVVAMIAIAIGLTMVFKTYDVVRVDTSSEGLSSLSPRTMKLLDGIKDKRSVHIEAYISPESEMPESYIQTRLNLLTIIDELKKRGGGKITARVNETESYQESATIAEQRYGITGQRVFTRDRGKFRESEVFMGMAVTSGLDKVIIPFFDRGVPAEYELVRSIVSLADKSRKTIGVVATDARLMGGFNQQSMQPIQKEAIVTELEKQYDVKEVNLSSPITEKYDVLLVVQPSSLENDAAIGHLLAAIRDGQPTVIFEDPQPFINRGMPGTNQPRQPQGGNPFQRRPPPRPKGNINVLWDLLEVDFDGNNIVWQNYNPYPKADHFPTEFVFVGKGSGQAEPFNSDNEITAGLQQLLLLCPGSINQKSSSKLKFQKLVQTGKQTGTVAQSELFAMSFFGAGGINPARRQKVTGNEYALAAHISGVPGSSAKDPHAGHGHPHGEKKDDEKKDEKKEEKKEINVVLVADVDVVSSAFFNIRNQGPNPDMDMHLDLDNVTFVLNVIDSLGSDDRFIDIRKKRRIHRTLTAFEKQLEDSRTEVQEAREKFREEYTKAVEAEEKKVNVRLEKEIKKDPNIDRRQFEILRTTAQEQLNKIVAVKKAQLEKKRDRDIKDAEAALELKVRRTQNNVKRLAVFTPPIIPLLIGIAVFFTRRSRELEGASRSRLR